MRDRLGPEYADKFDTARLGETTQAHRHGQQHGIYTPLGATIESVIRVTEIAPKPASEIFYQFAGTGGRVETGRLEVQVASAYGLPNAIEGLLVASDLQGIAPSWSHAGETKLLGIVVAEHLGVLAESGFVPDTRAMIAVLAGDFYSEETARKRGATGNVTPVWEAFDREFGSVIGVGGNHDEFGSGWKKLIANGRVSLLDGDTISRQNILIGGVSKIAGSPEKKGRRTKDEQLERLRMVVHQEPELLFLHEGPVGTDRTQRGNSRISDELRGRFSGLVICGHTHWEEPLAECTSFQVLNADSRVLILTA